MDIQQASKIAKQNGGIILGYHTVPLPVYHLIVSYETFDENPFFPIKRALLKCANNFEEKKNERTIDVKFISCLLGMDRHLVQQQFDELKEKNLIYIDPETTAYRISDEAKRTFLVAGARPKKRMYGSVLLDGATFKFLPKEAYTPILDGSVNIWNEIRWQNIEAHKPVDLSVDHQSADIINIKNALNRQDMSYQILGLEHKECSDFQVVDIKKKYIYPVYVVYIGKKDDSVSKLAYIGNVSIKTKALSKIDDYTFSIIRSDQGGVYIRANLGYGANEKTKNKCIGYCSDDKVISDAICNEYGLSTDVSDIVVNDSSQIGCHVRISKELLCQSTTPSKIIADCSNKDTQTGEEDPRCIIKLNDKKSKGIIVFKVEHQITTYIELNRAIRNSGSSKDLENRLQSITTDWRRCLIDMGEYSTLEEIDCDKYIHSL